MAPELPAPADVRVSHSSGNHSGYSITIGNVVLFFLCFFVMFDFFAITMCLLTVLYLAFTSFFVAMGFGAMLSIGIIASSVSNVPS